MTDYTKEPWDRNAIIEMLAAIEHDQWSDWAKSILVDEDISQERYDRWDTYLVPYDSLSEDVKHSDRKWAEKVYSVFVEALGINPAAVPKMQHHLSFIKALIDENALEPEHMIQNIKVSVEQALALANDTVQGGE